MSQPQFCTFGEHIATAIENLTDANWLTGLWDNRRFQLCKKPYGEFSLSDKAYLYETEKKSRSNVERRAVCRNKIESLFEENFDAN